MQSDEERIEPPPLSIMAALAAQEAGAKTWTPLVSFEEIGDTIPDGGVVCHQDSDYAPLDVSPHQGLPWRDDAPEDVAPESMSRGNRARLVPYVAGVVGACVLLCVLALGRFVIAKVTEGRHRGPTTDVAKRPRLHVRSPRTRVDAVPVRGR